MPHPVVHWFQSVSEHHAEERARIETDAVRVGEEAGQGFSLYMVFGNMVIFGFRVNFFMVPRWTIYPGASVPL